MLVFLAMYGVMFLMTQYFQLVLGYSPLDAALRLLPIALIMLVVTPFTPRIVHRFGGQPLGRRSAWCSSRSGSCCSRSSASHTPFWFCWLCLVPLMTGVSLSMSPMTASIMSAVPPRAAPAPDRR